MSPVAAQRAPKSAFIRALVVGLAYQLLLIGLQPMLEPAYVWVEVAVGVILAFITADVVFQRNLRAISGHSTLGWADYRRTILLTFCGMAVPIVLYEIVNHLVLNRPV